MQIPINKDLRDYKVKEIGNFSMREMIFIVIAVITAYGLFTLEQFLFDGEYFLPSCMIPAAIILAFGFLKPQNKTLLQYLKTVFIEQNLIPQILIWKSEFTFDVSEQPEVFGDEYKPDAEFMRQLEEMETFNQKNQKKKKETKKKDSKKRTRKHEKED